MKLYNTLTKQKETFVPIEANRVSMYVCGPTVYNYIHIGNARSTVAFDTIRRYFEYRGYTVDYVSNFTDVDDKIITKANELQLTPKQVADKFIEAFYADTALLNVKKATHNPRVMACMEDIIAFVSELIEKGYAYEVQDDVYYQTSAFEQYGKLSGQSLADLQTGASQRLDDSEQDKKQNPLDFALWKKAKDGEISWESPWGQGRPGWHIECSVMATKYLAETIDIHAGGHDLIFPHHENEIAQSEAKTGKPFANYWLHNGFVTFDGEKMSKSLGNFVLAHDLLQQVDPQVVRLLLASGHYRHPLAFAPDMIDEARNNLDRMKQAYRNVMHRLAQASDVKTEADEAFERVISNLEQQFVTEMDDDINVPNGLMVIHQMIKEMNRYATLETVSRETIRNVADLFSRIVSILGVVLEEEMLEEEILALIEERAQARANKDFVRSDEIRDMLKERGIILDDTPQGTRYRRM